MWSLKLRGKPLSTFFSWENLTIISFIFMLFGTTIFGTLYSYTMGLYVSIGSAIIFAIGIFRLNK